MSADGTHNQVQSDGQFVYSYDAEGNRTSREDLTSGEVTLYHWDHRNRLVMVEEKPSATGAVAFRVSFHYDLWDRRIGKEVDSDGDGIQDEAWTWVYDGQHAVLQLHDADGDGSGDFALTNRYLYGVFCCAPSGRRDSERTQGGASAADAAFACPGLVCCGPFGAEGAKPRSENRESRTRAWR